MSRPSPSISGSSASPRIPISSCTSTTRSSESASTSGFSPTGSRAGILQPGADSVDRPHSTSVGSGVAPESSSVASRGPIVTPPGPPYGPMSLRSPPRAGHAARPGLAGSSGSDAAGSGSPPSDAVEAFDPLPETSVFGVRIVVQVPKVGPIAHLFATQCRGDKFQEGKRDDSAAHRRGSHRHRVPAAGAGCGGSHAEPPW